MDAKERPTNQADKILSRREVMALASISGAAFFIGCGGASAASSTTATAATSSAGGTSTSGGTGDTCTVTPEGEIGPYFADDSAAGFKRSNVLTNIDGSGGAQAGVPLTLSIYVYDSENSCKALEGSQVDIWHCNAAGVYSDQNSEGTSGLTYLRGYQITDSTGLVTFKTIIPGWYEGRTTHIHLRVRSKYSDTGSLSDGTNTTQLFFPQTVIDYIYTNVAPYSSRGAETTSNAADHVYIPETHAETLLTLTGDASAGYASTVSIYLPITVK